MELSELIQLLKPGEIKTFLSFLHSRNKVGQHRSIQLFKAFVAKEEKTLKAKWPPANYRAVKKRLTDNLSAFIAEQIVENEAQVEIQLLKKLLLARKLMRFNNFESAHQLLLKIREEAINHFLYTLVNEIDLSLLECSSESIVIDQKKSIKLLENGLKQTKNQFQNKIAQSSLKRAFKIAESKGNAVLLEHEFEKYTNQLILDSTREISYQELLNMVSIADAHGSLTKNYAQINLFFIEKLRILEKSGPASHAQLPYHIKLLYVIANIYFRKKDFHQSFNFLQEMKHLMVKENHFFHDRFNLRYSNLYALNLFFTGKMEESIEVLDKVIESKSFKANEKINSYLIRSMVAFQQNDFKYATKLFSQFQESDKFYEKKMGLDWLLNKKYIEILLHMELKNDDFVASRIQSLTKKHGDYLKTKKTFKVLPFLKLIKEVYKNPSIAVSIDFEQKVEAILFSDAKDDEDLFLMCFYAWLKSKMTKQPIYTTTLKLLEQ